MTGKCKHGIERDECSQCFNELQIPVDAYFAERAKQDVHNTLRPISKYMDENDWNKMKDRIAALEAENDELKIERDRLLVLAIKWCDKTHHDWDEVCGYDISRIDLDQA